MYLRNAAYDLQLLRAATPPVPVVAVGNMTAGGTGKTPLVSWITQYLLSRGLRPALISRGYGRTSRGVRIVSDGTGTPLGADEGGDEPAQLARMFPGVPVIVGERRVEAATVAVERFRPDVLVLDDAYQHRAIGRHLNILVVDAGSDLTREPLLPAGRRREQLKGMRRASLLVFTRVPVPPETAPSGAVQPEAMPARAVRPGTTPPGTAPRGMLPPGTVPWGNRIRRWYDGEIVCSTQRISGFTSPSGEPMELAACRDKRALLVSGIGKPGQFEHDVRERGVDIAGHMRFRDHYRYTLRDIDAMLSRVRRDGADMVITTEKDMTRLRALSEGLSILTSMVPVVAAVLTLSLFPAGLLEARLDACTGRAA